MTQLPAKFVEMTRRLGLDCLAGALAESEPSVSVRLNAAKYDAEGCAELPVVPWCEEGRYLERRPAFTFDPLLHQGAYYVQDASSMIMSHVARKLAAMIGRPLAWLDACAAPGGKTTAAMAGLPEESVVVANEYVPSRAAILSENLAKWGCGRCVVTTGDTSRLSKLRNGFDVIAADVPCSGEGMMRKDADAVNQWSEGLIDECAERQWEIVCNLWPALKPGGYMVYSTFTFNRKENEDMVERIVAEFGAEPVDMCPDSGWNILPAIGSDSPAMRFIPGRVKGEGLFMAVLRKPGELSATSAASGAKVRKQGGRKVADQTGAVRSWLRNPDDYRLTVDEAGVIRAMPVSPLLPAGIAEMGRPVLTVGTVKGRDVIPSQALALSLDLDRSAFARADVDRMTALSYLRHESIVLPPDTPRGFVLLYHAGLPLGFVKNLGSRANNLYPQQWRILSAVPEPLPLLPLGRDM